MSVITAKANDAVAVVTIDREKALNALNSHVLNELLLALTDLDADDSVRAIVLRGAGERAFVAGADVKEMLDMSATEAVAFARFGHEVMNSIETFRTPIIAAVQGFALGGGFELAMAADMIVCTEGARFGLPEVTIGLVPGFGGTQRLRRLVGEKVAADLLYTGRHVKGPEAVSVGIASRLLPGEDFEAEAVAVANEIAANAPRSVEIAKELQRAARTADAEQSTMLETNAFGVIASLEDKRRGIEALLNKQKAEFEGN